MGFFWRWLLNLERKRGGKNRRLKRKLKRRSKRSLLKRMMRKMKNKAAMKSDEERIKESSGDHEEIQETIDNQLEKMDRENRKEKRLITISVHVENLSELRRFVEEDNITPSTVGISDKVSCDVMDSIKQYCVERDLEFYCEHRGVNDEQTVIVSNDNDDDDDDNNQHLIPINRKVKKGHGKGKQLLQAEVPPQVLHSVESHPSGEEDNILDDEDDDKLVEKFMKKADKRRRVKQNRKEKQLLRESGNNLYDFDSPGPVYVDSLRELRQIVEEDNIIPSIVLISHKFRYEELCEIVVYCDKRDLEYCYEFPDAVGLPEIPPEELPPGEEPQPGVLHEVYDFSYLLAKEEQFRPGDFFNLYSYDLGIEYDNAKTFLNARGFCWSEIPGSYTTVTEKPRKNFEKKPYE